MERIMRELFFCPIKDFPIKGDPMIVATSKANLKASWGSIFKRFFYPENAIEEQAFERMQSIVFDGSSSRTTQLELCYPENGEAPTFVMKHCLSRNILGERFEIVLSGPKPKADAETIVSNMLWYNDSVGETIFNIVTTKRTVLLEARTTDRILPEDIPETLLGVEAREIRRNTRKDITLYTFPSSVNGFLNPFMHHSMVDIGIDAEITDENCPLWVSALRKIIAAKIDKSTVENTFPNFPDEILGMIQKNSYDLFRANNAGAFREDSSRYGAGWKVGCFLILSRFIFHRNTRKISSTQTLPEREGETLVVRRDLFGKVLGLAVFSGRDTYVNWYTHLFHSILKLYGEQAACLYFSGYRVHQGLEIREELSQLLKGPNDSCTVGNFPMTDLVR